MQHILAKFHPSSEDVRKVVLTYAQWLPDESASDEIDELEIVQTAYDGALVVLFHEDGELGIRLDGIEPAPEAERWLRDHGVERLEGEEYVDPETGEEQVVHGPYARYPMTPEEGADILRYTLLNILRLPADTPLLATTIGNPDEWPFTVPDEWPMRVPPI